jgi:type IV pilus assembly protein PilE
MPGLVRRWAPGFTLVELCVVLAVASVLVTIAWPSFQSQLQRGRRAEAVTALLRVQLAQENYRSHHGLYASQLGVLVGAAAPRSSEGLYDIELRDSGADRYEARATARPGSVVASDAGCTVLSLQVRNGLADFAPSPRCWNR